MAETNPDGVQPNEEQVSEQWGEIRPGTVFWQDVTAPENSTLISNEGIARLLPVDKLKQLRRKMLTVSLSLADFDYRTFDKRLAYYRHMARRADAADKKKWVERYEALNENPPSAVKLSWKQRKIRLITIENQNEYNHWRLWLHKAELRLKEHETAVKNQVIYDQLAQEMLLEVGYFGQQLIQRWSALNNREEYYINGKKKVIRVRLEEAHYTPDEIQYKIKVSSRNIIGAVKHWLPDRVTAWNLVKPETLSELASACERPIGSPHLENTPDTFENGAWITVYRQGLTDGLFDFVEYEKVIQKYEPNKREKFPVPIGVKRGRMVEWLYLNEQPHLMVNGISGSGKTNSIRVDLVTWTRFHSPDEMRFFIIDLKRGGDFREFENIPHLAAPMITRINEMSELVPRLVALMQNRMANFATVAARDIDDWNAMVSADKRMPRIVIVIDECSSVDHLAHDKEMRQTIWRGLTLIATQSRAAGIHLLLGSQQSFSDAIPKSVRDNVTFVLSGRQRTLAASLATFGRGMAKELPNIRGRMWCDNGLDLFQIQTPYVSHETVRNAVELAMAYGEYPALILPDIDENFDALEAPAPVDMNEVLRVCIHEKAGRLSVVPIWEVLKNRASRPQITDIVGHIAGLGFVEYETEFYDIVKERNAYRLIKVEAETNQLANSQDD